MAAVDSYLAATKISIQQTLCAPIYWGLDAPATVYVAATDSIFGCNRLYIWRQKTLGAHIYRRLRAAATICIAATDSIFSISGCNKLYMAAATLGAPMYRGLDAAATLYVAAIDSIFSCNRLST